MVKRVLMIAYHFPPSQGSSGIQRTLKFSRYLPEFGWQPLVLTAHPRAYPATSEDQLADIPAGVAVYPAFALDAARHLSLKGRYPGWLALPDRWSSWWFGAVPAGLALIRRYRPDVIWSTYPIATAHLVGLTLHKATGIPWVADFRDPMTEEQYPPNPRTRRIYGWIERQAVAHCSRAILTTPGALNNYGRRFQGVPPARFSVVENGYDEESFGSAAGRAPGTGDGPFVLLHSGIVYTKERDPLPLFEALAELAGCGLLNPAAFRLALRASGNDAYLRRLIAQCGVEALVTLLPPLPYQEALAEMLSADGLLLLQAGNCNNQIPAKLYEYLRAQRPILALTDPAGDTAQVLKRARIDTLARLDSKDEIKRTLIRFLTLARAGRAPLAAMDKVAAYSRRSKTGELAGHLERALDRG